MKKLKGICLLTLLTITIFSLLTGCNKKTEQSDSKEKELNVLTSIYPMYDFAQKIGLGKGAQLFVKVATSRFKRLALKKEGLMLQT